MRLTIVVFGQSELAGNFRILKSIIERQGHTSAWNGAQHLFARTRAVVPYMEGVLYGAAYIRNIAYSRARPTWEVGYDTGQAPYALAVHDVPANHPTRGPSSEPKQDHFLSAPRDQMQKTYPATVRDDMRRVLRRVPVRRRSRARRR
jgi:hypothetical protein